MMKAMLFSGALAGLCGAVHVTSVGKRFISGFAGIRLQRYLRRGSGQRFTVRHHSGGHHLRRFKTGAMYLNMMSQIPTEFVSVIQALVVIFVSAPLFDPGLDRRGPQTEKEAGRTQPC